ncbi:hypothetical protein AB0N05_25440 [Nocardia sp. NPDC051030]|uniref:hypothetical protein n=1 Tax=Nocardia sp. NPDC051030 TaxID=3155162 RepID=UPI003414BCE7
MSNEIPADDSRPLESGRITLAEEDGILCWLERIEPDQCGELHTETGPSIALVVSGGPVEVVDEHEWLYHRTTLMSGQMIRSGMLPSSFRLCNVSNEPVVLIALEWRAPT